MPERCAGSHALPPPRPPLLALAQWGGAGQALRQVREGEGGIGGGNRTPDTLFWRQLLYH